MLRDSIRNMMLFFVYLERHTSDKIKSEVIQGIWDGVVTDCFSTIASFKPDALPTILPKNVYFSSAMGVFCDAAADIPKQFSVVTEVCKQCLRH